MSNRILTMGVLLLLVFSTIIPLTLGYNVKISNTGEQPSIIINNINPPSERNGIKPLVV